MNIYLHANTTNIIFYKLVLQICKQQREKIEEEKDMNIRKYMSGFFFSLDEKINK